MWDEATVRARTEVTLAADDSAYDVVVTVQTWRDGEPFMDRQWQRRIARDLG